MPMEEEILEVVNEKGSVLRLAPRSEIHGDPSLIHRVVHVLVFNERGELLLQKRSMNKDVAPGRWDTSVGGHVEPDEELAEAARREMQEELGISAEPEYLYSYIHSNPYETELVYTFECTHGGEVSFNAEEIDGVRPWPLEEILSSLHGDSLSDNFKHEISVYLEKKARGTEKEEI